MKKILLLPLLLTIGFSILGQPNASLFDNAYTLDLKPQVVNCYTSTELVSNVLTDKSSLVPSFEDNDLQGGFWYKFKASSNEINISLIASENITIQLLASTENVSFGHTAYVLANFDSKDQFSYDKLEPDRTYYLHVPSSLSIANLNPIKKLCISDMPMSDPINDSPCNAIFLNNDQTIETSNVGATSTFEDSITFPGISNPLNDVWFTLDVPFYSSVIELFIESISIDTPMIVVIGQFNDNCEGEFTWSESSMFSGDADTPIQFNCMLPGTYYVMVASNADVEGSFRMRLTSRSAPTACLNNGNCNSPIMIELPPFNSSNETVCLQGCNFNACPESITSLGCSYDGAIVWYAVAVPLNKSNISVSVLGTNANTFLNPFIQIFESPCGLNPVTICKIGTNGHVGLYDIAVTGGGVYYIAIGSYSDEMGYFNLCVSFTDLIRNCTRDDISNVINSPLCPGSEVNISYSFNYFSYNCQWPHAVIPVFGDCYDMDNLVMPNFGNWVWFPQGIVTHNLINSRIHIYEDSEGVLKLCYPQKDISCQGVPLEEGSIMPAGWYWINQQGSCGDDELDNPNNTWGLPCGCGSTCAAFFEFNLRIKNIEEMSSLSGGGDCGIQFYVFSDRHTGCWRNADLYCINDSPHYINNSYNIYPSIITLPSEISHCSGDTLTINLSNYSPNPNGDFSWTVRNASQISGAIDGSGKIIKQVLTNNTREIRTFIYRVTPEGSHGCAPLTPSDIFVTVYPTYDGMFMVTESICEYDSTELRFLYQGNSAFELEYTANDILQPKLFATSGIAEIMVSPNQTTTYKAVSIKGDYGCLNTNLNSQATLNINYSSFSAMDVLLCEGDSLVVNGTAFNEEGTYETVISGANQYQCDSIIIINIVIEDNYRDTLISSICFGESIVFGNDTLTESGVYYQFLQTQFGCDSIEYLSLIVGESIMIVDTIVEHDSGMGGSIGLSVEGGFPPYYFAWSNGSTVSTLQNIEPGDYILNVTDSLGCSVSMVFTVLDQTTSAGSVAWKGFSAKLYPIPTSTNGPLQLQIFSEVEDKATLICRNAVGQVMSESVISVQNGDYSYPIQTNLLPGVYLLSIHTSKGKGGIIRFIVY